MNNEWDDYSVDEPDTSDFGEYTVDEPESKIANVVNKIPIVNRIPFKELPSDALDLVKLYGQGRAFGLADELGGVVGAGAEAASNTLGINPYTSLFGSDEERANQAKVEELEKQGFVEKSQNLLDLYRQNQQMVQKDLEQSEERHPVTGMLANMAGSFQTGGKLGEAALGAMGIGAPAVAGSQGAKRLLDIYKNEGKMKALGEAGLRGVKGYGKTLPTLIPELAAYSKEGGLFSPEEREKLLSDEISGLTFGAMAQGGLHGIGEVASKSLGKVDLGASSFVNKIPMLRQAKHAREYGQQGINPKADIEQMRTKIGLNPSVSDLELSKNSPEILGKITEKEVLGQAAEIQMARDVIGKATRDAIDNSKKIIKIDDTVTTALQSVDELTKRFPELVQNKKLKDAYTRLSTGSTEVTPRQLKDFVDGLGDSINSFGGNPNSTEFNIRKNLLDVQKSLISKLKTEVPEYGQAAERFHQFQKLVPETIMAGEKPVDVVDKFYNDYNNPDLNIYDRLYAVNALATKQGQNAIETKKAFEQMISGRKTFDIQEAERYSRGEIPHPAFSSPAEELEKRIKLNSDKAIARNTMDETDPHTKLGSVLQKASMGFGGTAQSMLMSGANLEGRIERRIGNITNPVLNFTKQIYNAPVEKHMQIAQKLKSMPSFAWFGDSLETALLNKDTTKANKVLFTIMQNPRLREVLGDSSQNTEETEKTSGSYTPQP